MQYLKKFKSTSPIVYQAAVTSAELLNRFGERDDYARKGILEFPDDELLNYRMAFLDLENGDQNNAKERLALVKEKVVKEDHPVAMFIDIEKLESVIRNNSV